MNRWRIPALSALWVQVASVFAVATFAARHADSTWEAVIQGGEAMLAGIVLWWWTVIFSRISRGEGVPPTNGTLRALALFFPVLTLLRASLWAMMALALLLGAAPEANPVALTALVTVWGGAIFAGNAVYGYTLRVALEPGNLLARTRLLEWLNASAALSLGMAVLNVIPIRGFGDPPSQMSQLVYGVAGLLDVTATVLALLALLPQKPQREREQTD